MLDRNGKTIHNKSRVVINKRLLEEYNLEADRGVVVSAKDNDQNLVTVETEQGIYDFPADKLFLVLKEKVR